MPWRQAEALLFAAKSVCEAVRREAEVEGKQRLAEWLARALRPGFATFGPRTQGPRGEASLRDGERELETALAQFVGACAFLLPSAPQLCQQAVAFLLESSLPGDPGTCVRCRFENLFLLFFFHAYVLFNHRETPAIFREGSGAGHASAPRAQAFLQLCVHRDTASLLAGAGELQWLCSRVLAAHEARSKYGRPLKPEALLGAGLGKLVATLSEQDPRAASQCLQLLAGPPLAGVLREAALLRTPRPAHEAAALVDVLRADLAYLTALLRAQRGPSELAALHARGGGSAASLSHATHTAFSRASGGMAGLVRGPNPDEKERDDSPLGELSRAALPALQQAACLSATQLGEALPALMAVFEALLAAAQPALWTDTTHAAVALFSQSGDAACLGVVVATTRLHGSSPGFAALFAQWLARVAHKAERMPEKEAGEEVFSHLFTLLLEGLRCVPVQIVRARELQSLLHLGLSVLQSVQHRNSSQAVLKFASELLGPSTCKALTQEELHHLNGELAAFGPALVCTLLRGLAGGFAVQQIKSNVAQTFFALLLRFPEAVRDWIAIVLADPNFLASHLTQVDKARFVEAVCVLRGNQNRFRAMLSDWQQVCASPVATSECLLDYLVDLTKCASPPSGLRGAQISSLPGPDGQMRVRNVVIID